MRLEHCPRCQKHLRSQQWGAHVKVCDVTWDEIFRARINTDGPGGCWIWTDYTNIMGYGATRSFDGTPMVAVHRLIWQFSHGNITSEQFVLHKCDVPRCCNPEHLFLGNDAINHADMVAKGRHAHGERTNRAKLTEAQALAIMQQRPTDYGKRIKGRGYLARDLAAKHGVGEGQVFAIWGRRQWKHIPFPEYARQP